MARKTRKRRRKTESDSSPTAPVEPRSDVCVLDAESDTTVSDSKSQIDETAATESPDTDTDANPAAVDGDPARTIISAVDTNKLLLEKLLQHVSDLREVVDLAHPVSDAYDAEPSESDMQHDRLVERIDELENQISELEQQNSDLASQVANSSVRQTVSDSGSSSSDALSWEERKQLILQQMEDDTFDSEEFIASLQSESELESPSEFVDRLHSELENRNEELARREQELEELRFLLDQQSETLDGGVAIGAAAIAEMVDSDELFQQERERLKQLQAEWEEKFRQAEIDASLERAKLSRERQELAKKQAELEDQLEDLRRQSEQSQDDAAGSSRRWLVKLGLSDDS